MILIIGAVPRAIELLNQNYLFLFDQGEYFLAVKDIIVEKRLTLIGTEVGGIGGFFQGPGFYYFLTIPFILLKGDPYGGLVLMFVMGILTILLSAILFHKSLGKTAALLTAFFIALSPGIVHQSRFLWPPFFIAPLTIVFLYFIWQALRGKTSYIPLAFLTLGIMAHFEIATSATLLVSTLISLVVIRPKGIFKPKTIISSALILVFTQITLVLFDLRHDFLNTRGIIKFITYSSEDSYSFQNHLDVFISSFISVSHSLHLAALLTTSVVFGLILMFKDKKTSGELKKFLIFLVINPIILFVILLPMKSSLWEWWFLELPIMFCFLIGITFGYLLRQFKWGILIIISIGVFTFLSLGQIYKWYKSDFYDYGATSKIRGKIEAIDYIYKDAGGRNFNLLVFTPPVYTYAYDYLLWWHGRDKYGYTPGQEKKDTFYLLIEPDAKKPWSYKGWLETVIKTGKVEKTIALPNSGFIIQKRVEK